MILVCPSCSARFLVPAAVFAHGARHVRCARCAHQWLADTPMDITVVPFVPPAEEAASNQSNSATFSQQLGAKNLPVLRDQPWLIFLKKHGLTLVSLVLLAITAGLFASMIKLPPDIPKPKEMKAPVQTAAITRLEDGLTLQNVHSERRLENAQMMLVVSGEVFNAGDDTVDIPVIRAAAFAPNGSLIESWQIRLSAVNLEPKASVPFQSTIKMPRVSISEISLSFAGSEDGHTSDH